MRKWVSRLAILLSLLIGTFACQMIEQLWEQPAEPANITTVTPRRTIPTDKAPPSEQAKPSETSAPTTKNPGPIVRDFPQQSAAAKIQPEGLRTDLTHLSNLIDYQVLDENGDPLGIARDYIVNTCEAYLIYILMEPIAEPGTIPDNRVVIPFEAVTINSGVLDAELETIQLRLIRDQFAGAPSLPAGQQLTPTDWEAETRTFWSEAVRIGKLSSACNIPGGPVYKIAYASQLLGVELYDGQNNLLGKVQEAILAPESGRVNFYLVESAKGDGLILVHLRATNIPKEALAPGSKLTLVLLTDPKVYWDAPRLTSIEEADNPAFQSEMQEYWDR